MNKHGRSFLRKSNTLKERKGSYNNVNTEASDEEAKDEI